MKKCPKCGNKYIDNMRECPSCNVALEQYEEITTFELLKRKYQQIKNFIKPYTSKLKRYHVAIVYVALIALIFVSYGCGLAKKYDNSYIDKTFQSRKSGFDTLTEQQKTYDKHKTTKESLNSDILVLQKKVDNINDFEKEQETYNSEIESLSNQIDDLSSQKTQKEKTLSDIEDELSKY